jgi:hypothetical protein
MKGLIKSSLFVALGWLTASAGAQEIQWRASTPKSSTSAASTGESGVRGVSLSLPQPIGAPPGAPQAVVRGQAPDGITVSPLPKVELGGEDKKTPKPMPKDNDFTPPPPSALMPSPIFDPLGMHPDDCSDACGTRCGFGRWIGKHCGNVFGNHCGDDRNRFWVSAEYLMWWQRTHPTPPLITSSPAGVPLDQVGIVGLPSTSVLYDQTPDRMHSGGRFTAGFWSKHFCNLGIEASFFFLGKQGSTETFASDGSTQLGRPFFDSRGFQNSEIFASTDRTGTATISDFTRLWGFEVNLRRNLWCGPQHRIDYIAGYRHIQLSEGIHITEQLAVPATGAPVISFIERESFHTRTVFNGAQLGVDGECRIWNRWFLGWGTKVALGNAHHIVTIDGSTTRIIAGGTTETQPGALLATQTNIGRYTSNRFAVVPEVNLKIGYDLTDNCRIFVGYDFLYMSSVVRPGDQIDLNVNQSFRPFTGGAGTGPRQPAFVFRTTDYWAQGLNFGLLYRY